MFIMIVHAKTPTHQNICHFLDDRSVLQRDLSAIDGQAQVELTQGVHHAPFLIVYGSDLFRKSAPNEIGSTEIMTRVRPRLNGKLIGLESGVCVYQMICKRLPQPIIRSHCRQILLIGAPCGTGLDRIVVNMQVVKAFHCHFLAAITAGKLTKYNATNNQWPLGGGLGQSFAPFFPSVLLTSDDQQYGSINCSDHDSCDLNCWN